MPWWLHSCRYSRERNRVSHEASPPPIDGPHGRWTVPSHPSRGYSLFWGFPDSPVPTFGLPQVD